MRGANQGIMSVQFSKNDEFLLAGANDNITRIWHVESGRARFTFTGHIGKVFAAKFTGDSSRVVRETRPVDATMEGCRRLTTPELSVSASRLHRLPAATTERSRCGTSARTTVRLSYATSCQVFQIC